MRRTVTSSSGLCWTALRTIGEVVFHSGWTSHRAGANSSGLPREGMTVIPLDKNIRFTAPKKKHVLDIEWRASSVETEGMLCSRAQARQNNSRGFQPR